MTTGTLVTGTPGRLYVDHSVGEGGWGRTPGRSSTGHCHVDSTRNAVSGKLSGTPTSSTRSLVTFKVSDSARPADTALYRAGAIDPIDADDFEPREPDVAPSRANLRRPHRLVRSTPRSLTGVSLPSTGYRGPGALSSP